MSPMRAEKNCKPNANPTTLVLPIQKVFKVNITIGSTPDRAACLIKD